MNYRRLIALGVLFALLSGCASTTLVPIPQTVEVPVTVVVTATPVAKATATLAVDIPDDWAEYESITGEFTLRHPSGWKIADERESWVAFELPNATHIVSVGLLSVSSEYAVGDQASVNSIVSNVVSTMDKDTQLKVLSKGKWYHILPLNYAEFDGAFKGPIPFRLVFLQAPLVPRVAVFGFVRKTGGCIALAELEELQMMMASLESN